MFGSETFGMRPDVIVMSKQITSTYFPFSAFMLNDRVYDPIAEESGRIGVLGHGYTSGAHPVGAAVALENLNIIEERGLVAHAAELGVMFQNALREFESHPLVGEARGVGLIGALDLVTDKAAKKGLEAPGQLGALANAAFMENGVISRNLYDALAFCPPLIITEDQVKDMFQRVEIALEHVAKDIL